MSITDRLSDDERRVLPRFQKAEMLQHQALVLRSVLEVTTECMPDRSRERAGGDPWKLRGVPVIGVHGGVGGAIRGSKPHIDGLPA